MFWTRRRPPRDFSDEIESHLDLESANLERSGLRAEDARLEARRQFGSPLAAREQFYEATRWLWIDHLLQDIRYGARNLLRYPISCAVAVISLAAGIGATTATLTIRDVVFHKAPALYRNPGE